MAVPFFMEKILQGAAELGASDDVAGRNTGAGKTVFLALWRNF